MSYPSIEQFRGVKPLDQLPTELIKELQILLKKFDLYLGDVDGIVGPLLKEAFAKFKAKSYLENPDLLGTATVKVLLSEARELRPAPFDQLSPNRIRGKEMKLPSGLIVHSDEPILDSHFTWGEATKGCTRVPASKAIENVIAATARYMDKVRSHLGDRKIIVTSWYRPLVINQAVGGVSNSRHLYGDGIDFNVEGLSPHEVQRRLDDWHRANGGIGQSSQFTHLDRRGYRVRWRYGR